jgi:hypothetical protein
MRPPDMASIMRAQRSALTPTPGEPAGHDIAMDQLCVCLRARHMRGGERPDHSGSRQPERRAPADAYPRLRHD